MKAQTETEIEIILFDLGGVLVNYQGGEKIAEWTRGKMDQMELYRWWVSSPWVLKLESGRCSPEQFANAAVLELKLSVTPEEMLAEAESWLIGLDPDATSLLGDLSGRFTLATLCNTNAIYWKRLQRMGFLHLFQHLFPSHQTGLLKPDPMAFKNVTNRLGSPPSTIFFLDDQDANVEAARAEGMRAEKVQGAAQARLILAEAGLM